MPTAYAHLDDSHAADEPTSNTCFLDYPELIADWCLAMEHTYLDACHRTDYHDARGTFDDWQDALDREAQLSWWMGEIGRLFPNATACVHGLSLNNCYGPAHYSDNV